MIIIILLGQYIQGTHNRQKGNTASHALVTENVSKLQLRSAMIKVHGEENVKYTLLFYFFFAKCRF